MLVDGLTFEGDATIVADNVPAFPVAPEDGALVYLLEIDQTRVPGLYIFEEGAWVHLTKSEPVSD